MRSVSSGSSGIGRGMKDGENSQSISRFFPTMSSTQKEQNVSEAGVADSQSMSDVGVTERHSAINGKNLGEPRHEKTNNVASDQV